MLSWADKIRAAQEEQAAKIAAGEQLPVSTPQVVVAPMSNGASSTPAPVQHHVTTTGVERLRQSSKGLLVLDTNAFLQGISHLMNEADVFVTTPQVLQECKDVRTREYLERLPFQLDVIDPQPESIQEVMDIAAKTGDLGALSRTDIRLCALALECARHADAMKPAIEPRAAVLNDGVNGVTIDAQERSDSDDDVEESEEEEEEEEEAAPAAAAAPKPSKPDADDRDAELPGWGNFDDSWGDDDGEVLNVAPMPGSAKAHAAALAARSAPPRPAADPRVTVPDFYAGGFACITSDFPMQNTLLHLGVPVLGARGGRITQLRVWLLRCHACFHLVHDTTRQFCPECGSGDTLKRVSYVVHEDGTKKLFINFRHHISTRGTIYNLPRPKGGRNGTNKRLVLREDQLKNCGRVDRKAAVQRVAASDLDGFAEHRPTVHRSGDNMRVKSSYSRRNINEVRKARAARHK